MNSSVAFKSASGKSNKIIFGKNVNDNLISLALSSFVTTDQDRQKLFNIDKVLAVTNRAHKNYAPSLSDDTIKASKQIMPTATNVTIFSENIRGPLSNISRIIIFSDCLFLKQKKTIPHSRQIFILIIQ